MKYAKGITIKISIPKRYAPCRSEFRKGAKKIYPGASVRTRIVSGTGLPVVEEVRFTKNHPLGNVDIFTETIIASLGENLGRLAIRSSN